jgi:DNA-binding NarL/FixJ family response regulator
MAHAPRATGAQHPEGYSGHVTASQWPDFLVGQPSRPVRVLLVDDDAAMRKVISSELLADLRCDLVAQASTVRDGRRLILQREFDVLLVGLQLADGSGLSLIEHTKIVRPLAESIVIATVDDDQSTLRAFEMGATGYLLKNSWFGNFPQAVLQVVNGGASITPSLARRLLQRLEHASTPAADGRKPGAPHNELSVREMGVLKMVAGGYTSGEIGLELNISSQTVNTHIKSIYRKLQVRTRAQAVSFAAHRGWL